MKRITITENSGQTIEKTASDDAEARWYEDLPFESEHIASVTVTDD